MEYRSEWLVGEFFLEELVCIEEGSGFDFGLMHIVRAYASLT